MARLHSLGNAGSHPITPLFTSPLTSHHAEHDTQGQRAKSTGSGNVLGKTEAHEFAPGADIARVLV